MSNPVSYYLSFVDHKGEEPFCRIPLKSRHFDFDQASMTLNLRLQLTSIVSTELGSMGLWSRSGNHLKHVWLKAAQAVRPGDTITLYPGDVCFDLPLDYTRHV